MLFTYTAGALVAASLSLAQSSTDEPCAQVSNYVASGVTYIPAEIANECLLSAPLVEQDALDIIDGTIALLEWQTTLAWLKDPPSDYQFPAIDLVQEFSDLRDRVSSGNITGEIEFERAHSSILNRAHDGHLAYQLDGLSAFSFVNAFGSLDIVSIDGTSQPGVYLHTEMLAYASGYANEPSAIVQINGQNATDYLSDLAENQLPTLTQDKDAAFNAMFWGPTNGQAAPFTGYFAGVRGVYLGNETSLEFANGSTSTLPNYASTQYDFSGVIDGPSFSDKFCNSTNKAARSGGSLHKKMKRDATRTIAERQSEPSATVTQLPGYPTPVAISTDGSLSGYFLDDVNDTETAVLVLTTFTFTAMQSVQSTLADFLEQCRSQNKKYLVIDLTFNGGGAVDIVYDFFKQLFPDIDPYAAGNYRAHDTLDIVGQAITDNAQKAESQVSSTDFDALSKSGAYSSYNGRAFNNASGKRIGSWDEYYGPVTAKGDNFTNLFRWDLNNVEYTANGGGIVISGYGNQTVAPQVFDPKNMIILGDGFCGSSCTSLSHLLKWQGKVKSIVTGGRPQTGPMQQQGAVKGSQVEQFYTLVVYNIQAYMTEEQIGQLNTTSGGSTLTRVGQTMLLRGASAGTSPEDITFNVKNNIAEGDSSYTPLQFVYEAADCKMYNQPSFYNSLDYKWSAVANNAFGLNGTEVFANCVKDSTNDPSSLSGNTTLYNNGVATNVTDFVPEGTDASDGGSHSGSTNNNKNSNGKKNAGARLEMPLFSAFAVLVAVFLSL